jgi:multidrug efflux pump subunit AcrA (membrane-fusion protein)
VANPKQKLLPGMVTTVKFINEGSQAISGISVPVTAVQRGTDKSYFVWIVDSNNTAHRNKVSVGSTSGNYISITEGIKVGQRIVTEGYQKLSEGTKVVF